MNSQRLPPAKMVVVDSRDATTMRFDPATGIVYRVTLHEGYVQVDTNKIDKSQGYDQELFQETEVVIRERVVGIRMEY